MTAINVKKKNYDKKPRIIFLAAVYSSLALFIIGLFLFSAYYSKIYESPEVSGGKADFNGVDLPSRDVACNLAGEWDFFYGKWIVTDGYDGEPDGMISLPGLWTYKDFGSGALPKTGYASYRLTAFNVQSGINVKVYRHYANVAYRVFINGNLCYRSGELSKDAHETVVTGATDEERVYYADGSPLEIVIEVSACDSGGFNAAPWLAAQTSGQAYGMSLRSMNYFALGVTTAAVIISILSFLFFRYKRDITVPMAMVALYVHFLVSKDMLYVFRMQITAAMAAELFSAIAALIVLIIHFRRSGATIKKPFVIVTSVAGAVFTGLVIGFYGTPIAPVCAFALWLIAFCYLVPVVLNEKFNALQYCAYGLLYGVLISVYCFELCDGLGLLAYGTEFIFTIELMLIIACFAALWLWKNAVIARTAIRAGELERELIALKNKALKAQIKPHFVYNSLTAIQARYRDGLEKGDKAIEQFAKHLRLVTDSDGEDMIAFEDEVRNVLNYFELENLRSGEKLNLLLDLEFTDFSVPVLSLQPYVENAIKHGGLRQKYDGYIQLSSKREDGVITVSVTDNGVGFDLTAVREGVGMENTRKRFELIGAAVSVTSTDCGTQVSIEIPFKE